MVLCASPWDLVLSTMCNVAVPWLAICQSHEKGVQVVIEAQTGPWAPSFLPAVLRQSLLRYRPEADLHRDHGRWRRAVIAVEMSRNRGPVLLVSTIAVAVARTL